MARSIKKGPYVEPKLLRKVELMNKSGRKARSNAGNVQADRLGCAG